MISRLLQRWLGHNGGGLGAQGERLVARWLSRQGYEIIGQNVTIARHEIDLLARDPDGRTVVLVEVKTRTSPMLPAESAVTREKRRRLLRAAQMLKRQQAYAAFPMRFDVVTVVRSDEDAEPHIRHYVAAFDATLR